MNLLQTIVVTIGILGGTAVLAITAKDLSKQRLNSQVVQLKDEVAALQQVVDICSKIDQQ